MRKLVAVASIVSLVSVLGMGSALADPFTICVKDKNGKMNRGALGDTPAKGQCQNENKWSEVTLATEQNVIDLAFDLELTQEQLDILDDQINEPDGIADMVQMNKEAIAALQDGGISSMIGGGHNSSADGADTFYMPLYNWFRIANEDEAASKVAVTGWLTKLSVITNEPVGADASEIFKYVVDGVPIDLDGLIETVCIITGDSSTMCESTGCFAIDMGQTLSVQVLASNSGASPNVSGTRWTGRFVETEADCPPLL